MAQTEKKKPIVPIVIGVVVVAVIGCAMALAGMAALWRNRGKGGR